MSSDLSQVLVSLLPVIVGGLIGTLGGLIGPPLIHRLTEKSDKRKKREEKLEELIAALYEHDHWLKLMMNIRVFGEEDTNPPSPLPKARAVATIYFPTFVEQINQLEMTARLYEKWMLEGAQKRLAKKTDNLIEGIEGVYEPYLGEFGTLISALQNWAKKEFGH